MIVVEIAVWAAAVTAILVCVEAVRRVIVNPLLQIRDMVAEFRDTSATVAEHSVEWSRAAATAAEAAQVARETREKVEEALATLEIVRAEVTSNDGSSMRDMVARIEERQEHP